MNKLALVTGGGRGLGRSTALAQAGVDVLITDHTHENSEAMFDQLMSVHLEGVFFLAQSLLPRLADRGRIVNLSSGLTRFSLPGYADCAMMKGGIEVFTRYLAKELGPRGIAVNTVDGNGWINARRIEASGGMFV